MINPLDIERKEFRSAMRGYDKQDVKSFMSEVANTLEKSLLEIEELKKKNAELSSEVQKYKQVEETMSETLLVAKKTADELIASAKKKEAVMIKEAEIKISDREKKSEMIIVELERKIDELKLKYESEKIRLSGFLRAQLSLLEDDIPTIESIKESSKSLPGARRTEVIHEHGELDDDEAQKAKDRLHQEEDDLDVFDDFRVFDDLPSLKNIKQDLENIKQNLEL